MRAPKPWAAWLVALSAANCFWFVRAAGQGEWGWMAWDAGFAIWAGLAAWREW